MEDLQEDSIKPQRTHLRQRIEPKLVSDTRLPRFNIQALDRGVEISVSESSADRSGNRRLSVEFVLCGFYPWQSLGVEGGSRKTYRGEG